MEASENTKEFVKNLVIMALWRTVKTSVGSVVARVIARLQKIRLLVSRIRRLTQALTQRLKPLLL